MEVMNPKNTTSKTDNWKMPDSLCPFFEFQKYVAFWFVQCEAGLFSVYAFEAPPVHAMVLAVPTHFR